MQGDCVKPSPIGADSSNDHAQTRSPESGKLGNSGGFMPGELIPGVFFQNTFRIVHKLGAGTLGPVYLADHVFLDQPRALRILPRQLVRDEALLARFRRELNALRDVRSRNVIGAGDLQFTDDETPFIAIDYVDGPDLGSLLDIAPGPFEVDLTLVIARCIAEGLAAAHACGLVHRDLQPRNIFMAREGSSWVPKIAGFALVAIKEHIASPRSTGETVLTPTYAAPEQWYGADPSDLDGRTDLYALGGVLYKMLTGHSAFHAADYEGWAMQHIKTQPLPPSALRPGLAAWNGLDDLILRLLAKECEARPRRAAELLPLLDAVRFGAAIAQSPGKAIEEEPQATPLPEAVIAEAGPQSSEVDLSPPAVQSHIPSAAATGGRVDEQAASLAEPASLAGPAIVAEPPTVIADPDTPIAAEQACSPLPARAVPGQPVPAHPLPAQPAASSATNTFSAPEQELENPAQPQAGQALLNEPTATIEESRQSAETKTSLSGHSEAFVEEPESMAEPESLALAEPRSAVLEGHEVNPELTTLKSMPEWVQDSTAEEHFEAAGINEAPLSAASEPPAMEQEALSQFVPLPEPAIELTPEQKELAELQRIFSTADAARIAEGKPARTPRQGRSSAYPETPHLPSLPSGIKAPAAAGITTPDSARTTAAGSLHKPDQPDETDAAGETTAERFVHPVWKIFAALVLLSVVGFAGWRLNYTDPTMPPKNLSQGCNAGDARVCSQLAAWYEQTNVVRDGDSKAVAFYTKACNGSFPLACRKLGYKYLFGKGIPEDKPRALPLMARACDLRDYESCDVLAEIYHNGDDVPKDDAQATLLYNKSCSLGEDFGCKWAARLDALNHPAPPPVHRPRPAADLTPAPDATPAP